MIRYLITDRAAAGGLDRLAAAIGGLLARRAVDFVQIREKDLDARALLDFTRRVLAMPNPGGARVLVNTRADVALAAGAHGVHLPGDSMAPRRLREILPAGAIISVACHCIDEVRRAEDEGADLALFSPIFAVEGKAPPQGLERLAQAARAVRIPVLALGGIRAGNLEACLQAGAAGVAGIRLFLQRPA